MYRYLALVFFVVSVNCAPNSDPASAFFKLLNTPELVTPPETDIQKIINSLNEIPQPLYQETDSFLKETLPTLQSVSAENHIRQHLENGALIMAFFEKTKLESNSAAITTLKENMKQLGPKFAESLAKIGQSSNLAAAPLSQQSDTPQLAKDHEDLVLKSFTELGPEIIQKLKSYVNGTVEKLIDANIKFENVVLKHLSKSKLLFDLFEATSGKEPTEEDLKANPWIPQVTQAIVPLFLQEMVYAAEFANFLRLAESAAAKPQV